MTPLGADLNTGLAFRPVAHVVGGLLIGWGMAIAQSCVSGLLFKFGAGMLGARWESGAGSPANWPYAAAAATFGSLRGVNAWAWSRAKAAKLRGGRPVMSWKSVVTKSPRPEA